jgi:glycerophosphoryl diester phosphodiesterase
MINISAQVLAAILLAGGAFAGEPEKVIQIYAHRGARAFAPENTLPGFKTGLRIGTDWVDMDVVLTKDGEVLVSHDLLLNPNITRNAKGEFLPPDRDPREYAAKNLTLEELQRFDVGRLNPNSAYAKFFPDQFPADGARMPTLREVVRYVNKAAHDKVGFEIEMKTDPLHPERTPDPGTFAAALYKVMKEEGILGRAEIQAFDWRCLYELQKLDEQVKTAYLSSRENEQGGAVSFFDPDPKRAGLWTGGKLVGDYGDSIPKMVHTLGGFAWEPEDATLTKEALDEAHNLGLKVVVWSWPEKLKTAFDAKLVDKLITWGVDGIVTDDPGRLASMLAARGLHVPERCPAQ